MLNADSHDKSLLMCRKAPHHIPTFGTTHHMTNRYPGNTQFKCDASGTTKPQYPKIKQANKDSMVGIHHLRIKTRKPSEA